MNPTPPTQTPPNRLESNRAWKERNKERLREQNKIRSQKRMSDPLLHAKKLEQDRQSRKRNAEKYRAYDRQRDPLKKSARVKLRHMVYDGKIKRLPCEVCGEPKTQGHHGDYSKPLEVKWLCAKHHKEIHVASNNS